MLKNVEQIFFKYPKIFISENHIFLSDGEQMYYLWEKTA